MGFQLEVGQHSTVPKLPLFSKTVPPMMQSPDHTGMLTPPLYTLASVPFQWEEEPGKPRPCTALIALPNPKKTETKCLELPPRLFMESTTKITKTPSPTTVLDGPYVGRSKLSSSSFRSLMEGKLSFDSTSSRSPEKGQLRTVVLCNKGHKRRGLFDSWGKKNLKLKGQKKEIGDDNAGTKAKFGKLTRNGSFSSFTQARSKHLWDVIYEGFKQVIPWKKRKSN
ncbi:Hypothetical predicted protein [Olea europaea subsp. europaea]|uniref:Uncharacterized protein n=2 Tax=Olea europaea subsp. europaea TaxID=158383 RepID=A0A8S0U3V5_OLEEU|nr:Hypothetical predicted protein [Olea europaea subsp. europaea]